MTGWNHSENPEWTGQLAMNWGARNLKNRKLNLILKFCFHLQRSCSISTRAACSHLKVQAAELPVPLATEGINERCRKSFKKSRKSHGKNRFAYKWSRIINVALSEGLRRLLGRFNDFSTIVAPDYGVVPGRIGSGPWSIFFGLIQQVRWGSTTGDSA